MVPRAMVAVVRALLRGFVVANVVAPFAAVLVVLRSRYPLVSPGTVLAVYGAVFAASSALFLVRELVSGSPSGAGRRRGPVRGEG